MSDKPEEISIPTWWERGGMMTRRSCLESDHPESEYQYVKRTYNVDPEDYGIFHSDHYLYQEHTREQLIKELVDAKREIKSMYQSGMF